MAEGKVMNGIYELILRAPDGRERRTLAWLPTDKVRQEYYNKAHKRGLEVICLTPDPSPTGEGRENDNEPKAI